MFKTLGAYAGGGDQMIWLSWTYVSDQNIFKHALVYIRFKTMFSSLLRSLPQIGRRWKPLNFSNPNFIRIPQWHAIDEETLPGYVASQYYPARIGEAIRERYQVIGKLGFGSTSTAWLARDME